MKQKEREPKTCLQLEPPSILPAVMLPVPSPIIVAGKIIVTETEIIIIINLRRNIQRRGGKLP
ncbi:hypothetical protein Hanom_Chr15g01375481 [Helianthus anomalus]